MLRHPAALKQGPMEGVCNHFGENEFLYRRIPLSTWAPDDDDTDEDDVSMLIDESAYKLPDISTIRSKFGHPEWVRLTNGFPDASTWGVIGIKVADIPQTHFFNGFRLAFNYLHVPIDWCYPHSEIRAYDKDGNHIAKPFPVYDEEFTLLWRAKLLKASQIFCRPGEVRDIPDARPHHN